MLIVGMLSGSLLLQERKEWKVNKTINNRKEDMMNCFLIAQMYE